MTTQSVNEFLYPRAFTHNTQLNFLIKDAVVAVGAFEGITAQNLSAMIERGHEYIELLQCIRYDVWSMIRHMSVSFDDIWIHVGFGYEVVGFPFTTHIRKQDVVLVVAVPIAGRADAGAVVVSMQSGFRGLRTLQRATKYVTSLMKRYSSYKLGLMAVDTDIGASLDVDTRKMLQALRFLSSTNTLEEVLVMNKNSDNGDTIPSFYDNGRSLSGTSESGGQGNTHVVHASDQDIKLFFLEKERRKVEREALAVASQHPEFRSTAMTTTSTSYSGGRHYSNEAPINANSSLSQEDIVNPNPTTVRYDLRNQRSTHQAVHDQSNAVYVHRARQQVAAQKKPPPPPRNPPPASSTSQTPMVTPIHHSGTQPSSQASTEDPAHHQESAVEEECRPCPFREVNISKGTRNPSPIRRSMLVNRKTEAPIPRPNGYYQSHYGGEGVGVEGWGESEGDEYEDDTAVDSSRFEREREIARSQRQRSMNSSTRLMLTSTPLSGGGGDQQLNGSFDLDPTTPPLMRHRHISPPRPKHDAYRSSQQHYEMELKNMHQIPDRDVVSREHLARLKRGEEKTYRDPSMDSSSVYELYETGRGGVRHQQLYSGNSYDRRYPPR